MPGNLGAAMRVAANFGVPRLALVRCSIDPCSDEVRRWACGGDRRLEITHYANLKRAISGYRTLVATASARGRANQPVQSLTQAHPLIHDRGLTTTAVVFGCETSGLSRGDLDLCDLVVRIPTVPEFPVLNLTQSIAITLAQLCTAQQPSSTAVAPPASQEQVQQLMAHLRHALQAIGFLDEQNPQRNLRKLRRLFGRAGITENEVGILRGICRQVLWAARTGPLRAEEEDTASGSSARRPTIALDETRS